MFLLDFGGFSLLSHFAFRLVSFSLFACDLQKVPFLLPGSIRSCCRAGLGLGRGWHFAARLVFRSNWLRGKDLLGLLLFQKRR